MKTKERRQSSTTLNRYLYNNIKPSINHKFSSLIHACHLLLLRPNPLWQKIKCRPNYDDPKAGRLSNIKSYIYIHVWYIFYIIMSIYSSTASKGDMTVTLTRCLESVLRNLFLAIYARTLKSSVQLQYATCDGGLSIKNI